MTRVAVALFRLMVRGARGEAADLRARHAEETFRHVLDAAALRGPLALVVTTARELGAVAGAVISARLRRGPSSGGWMTAVLGALSVREWRTGGRALVGTHRAFFVMAIGVLGLAVGMNLVVFTVVNAVWLRSPVIADPDRVVVIPGLRYSIAGLSNDRLRVFEGGVAGQVDTSEARQVLEPKVVLSGHGRVLETLGVTDHYFDVLGVPVRGRAFEPADDLPGAEPVAVISDRVWARVFGRNEDVIGTVVGAEPAPLRIIGVAAPGFHGARRGEQADVWLTPALVHQFAPAGTTRPSVMILARLGPSQTIAAVHQAMFDQLPEQERSWYNTNGLSFVAPVPITKVFGTPNLRTVVIDEGSTVQVVAGLALLVLLGGCATVAALVLVHYERRRSEFAVRLSLGASRTRLATELLRDLTLVGVFGTATGLLVAGMGLAWLTSLSLSLPGGVVLGRLDLAMDWRVVAVGVSATLTTLLVAAARPLVQFTQGRLAGELITGGRGVSRSSQRVRQGLLAVQVAATMVVLVSAGLFVRSVLYGFYQAPGFDIGRTVFVSVYEQARLSPTGPDPRGGVAARNQRLRERLSTIAGVEQVADGLPPIGPADRFVIKTLRVGEVDYQFPVGLLRGDPAQSQALGVPLLAGRPLSPADAAAAPAPALVTRSLAERLWPDGHPIGHVLRVPNSRFGSFEIVGVVGDYAFGSLTDTTHGVLMTAQAEMNGSKGSFIIRTAHPDDVAAAVLRLFPSGAATVSTGQTLVANDLGRQRLGAWFFSGFGLVALLLGIGGAFGLVAYLAESRRRELGVRLALGATPRDLLGHGLAAALKPVAVGVVTGLAAAAGISRLFASALPGISPLDITTYAVVALITLASAAAAAVVASWRLRGSTPSDALRAS